jgi:hypothetical protein
MTAMRFTNAQVALLALCALLFAALIYELFAPLREYRPPAVDNSHAAYAIAMPAMYTPPAFETYANIDEKSAFNPLRTPIVTDSGGTATAAGDALPSDLALVGVIMDGPTKMALLKSSAAPLVVGVPEGGVFEGWQIASVEPDKVVFAAHGDRQELRLSDNKRPAAPDSDQPDKPDDASSDDKPAPAAPQAQSPAPPGQAPVKNDDSDQ